MQTLARLRPVAAFHSKWLRAIYGETGELLPNFSTYGLGAPLGSIPFPSPALILLLIFILSPLLVSTGAGSYISRFNSTLDFHLMTSRLSYVRGSDSR